MGLGIAAVQNLLELWQLGYLNNTNKVFEMGSQELHLNTADFHELINMAGVTNFDKEKFSNIDNWPNEPHCSSRPLYQMLGFDEYNSFDFNEKHGAIVHDFNLPFENSSLYSQFDLVTDHGACEHAFNIAETYRTMHRLCKLGGLIIIAQTLWGTSNGYFLLDKHFFDGLASANNYKILFNSYIISTGTKTRNGSQHQFHIPMNRELLNTLDVSKVEHIGVYGVLQKQIEADFKFPYQNSYLSKQQGHLGFNRLFYKDPPSYSYIPLMGEDVSSKIFLKEIIKRIKNRIIKSK